MQGDDLLVKAFVERVEKFETELAGCKNAFTEAAVHDYRVASRRLIAVLGLIKQAEPKIKNEKIQKKIKEHLKKLNDLRDTQMMLAEFAKVLGSYPELLPIHQKLERSEKAFLGEAKTLFRETRWKRISKKLRSIQQELGLLDVKGNDSLNLLLTVDQVFGEVKHRIRDVDASKPSTIHHVRVFYKKFRYMIEIVYPLFPEFPQKQFESMHDYQSAMGDIQDIEVILRNLNSFSDKHANIDTALSLQYFEEQHAKKIKLFMKKMDDIELFWRESSGLSYPWERSKVS